MNAHDIIIILNLIIIESLLSVDNAAVLAVMVKDLPGKQSNRALRYGLIGAYVFRGLCLLIASWLVKFWYLKLIGGAYLLWLAIGHWTKKNDTIEEVSSVQDSKIFRWASKIGLNQFWATVVLVEIMDLAFSMDNVFAAVALSNNFWVVMTGVAIGILAMRFVAGKFVILMKRYPSLEDSAFIVIALLGAKLIISGFVDGAADVDNPFRVMIESHWFDIVFSVVMMAIFFVPLLFKKNRVYESN